MQDDTKGASSELPEGRPAYLLACAIVNAADTERAVAELNENGFSRESLAVLHGEEGASALRTRGSHETLLHRLVVRFNEFAGATDDFVRHHIELAEQGQHVVLVALPSGDTHEVERVWEILKRHNAHEGVVAGAGTNYELPEHSTQGSG
jgi:hypothetical protein